MPLMVLTLHCDDATKSVCTLQALHLGTCSSNSISPNLLLISLCCLWVDSCSLTALLCKSARCVWGVQGGGKVRVAVIREEGSNGDREMAAAVWSGGMEPWDVTMSDLLNGRAALDSFQGHTPAPFQLSNMQCLHQDIRAT